MLFDEKLSEQTFVLEVVLSQVLYSINNCPVALPQLSTNVFFSDVFLFNMSGLDVIFPCGVYTLLGAYYRSLHPFGFPRTLLRVYIIDTVSTKELQGSRSIKAVF